MPAALRRVECVLMRLPKHIEARMFFFGHLISLSFSKSVLTASGSLALYPASVPTVPRPPNDPTVPLAVTS